jgi:hypothetical protein
MSKLSILGSLAIIAVFVTGCSSDVDTAPFEKELKGESGGSGVRGAVPDYPAAPYGFAIGSTLPNFEFYGWKDPASVGFKTDQLERISLADYYDPTGSKGSKLLHINVSAVWCGFCRAEHEGGTYQLEDGSRITYIPLEEEEKSRYDRGLRYLGSLVQDNQGGPATKSDLEVWAEEYELGIPFALDPAFKLAPLRTDDNSWPINFIISTRDMKIVNKILGADPEQLWGDIDNRLNQ